MITFPRTCGTCARFEACKAESNQVMQALVCDIRDDYDSSKSIPACPDYQEKKP